MTARAVLCNCKQGRFGPFVRKERSHGTDQDAGGAQPNDGHAGSEQISDMLGAFRKGNGGLNAPLSAMHLTTDFPCDAFCQLQPG